MPTFYHQDSGRWRLCNGRNKTSAGAWWAEGAERRVPGRQQGGGRFTRALQRTLWGCKTLMPRARAEPPRARAEPPRARTEPAFGTAAPSTARRGPGASESCTPARRTRLQASPLPAIRAPGHGVATAALRRAAPSPHRAAFGTPAPSAARRGPGASECLGKPKAPGRRCPGRQQGGGHRPRMPRRF